MRLGSSSGLTLKDAYPCVCAALCTGLAYERASSDKSSQRPEALLELGTQGLTGDNSLHAPQKEAVQG